MSIATAISALKSASSDIASAIAAKGVSVPSGSGFDDYASLIVSIPQDGGGGGSSDPELPVGYTRKSYIYGGGSSCIMTGVSGNCTWKITAQADSGQNTRYFVICQYSVGYYFGLPSNGYLGFSTTSNQYTTAVSASSKMCATVLFGDNYMAASINTKVIYRNAALPRSQEWGLFGTASGNKIKAKLWEAEAWDGSGLLFRGIPCTNPQNVAGLYDTVSKTFFASDGNDDFTAGND